MHKHECGGNIDSPMQGLPRFSQFPHRAIIACNGQNQKYHRRFHAPSNVHIDVGVAAAGTGAPDGDRSNGITGLVVDFITPETEHSCWYFWGMARDFQQDDVELTDRIREGQRGKFAQDIDVLESQQRSLLQNADRRLANLDIDAGSQHSRRIIEKLCTR